jgi:sigma-B regulation protein RsbU (phosphoserine phosphatase)
MTNRRAHILVVDDNEDNREMLARRIKRQGHTVREAANGLQALERLREQPFDLVLLDIMMPEMNGYQVLEHMHADLTWRHIPVVVISALDDMDSVVRCIELGAEDYLFKPFNAVLLNARVAACLEKKWLRDQEQAYLAAIRREMQLGRQIQADFLPGELPQLPGWEIATAFHPAYEVAGDFYDVFWVTEGRIGLLLGDVSGKGVGAALFMALTRSLLRAFSDQATSTASMLDAVCRTNHYILRHHQQRTNMFATLFFGVLETDTGVLTYINAGHPPPILVRSSGEKEYLAPTAPLVGVIEGIPFETQQVALVVGDVLLAYTDGVTEAMDAAQQPFGAERLLAILDQGIPTVEVLLERIETSVHAHVGEGAVSDDVTMLAIRWLA